MVSFLSYRGFAGFLGCLLLLTPGQGVADEIYVGEEQRLRVSVVHSDGTVQPFANNVGLMYGLAPITMATCRRYGDDENAPA
jgi:hypothetical protein